MRTARLVPLVAALASLSAIAQSPLNQPPNQAPAIQIPITREPGALGGIQSFGISSSFSPDSSHILIGLAQQRKTWTLGVEYTRLLHLGPHFRYDYEATLLPLYEESDPTVTGTLTTLGGQTFITSEPPVRVTNVQRGPIGTAEGLGSSAPIYAIFGREDTYAWSLAPFGARLSAFPRSTIQPSLSVDLGFVVSTRDIPVDQSDQFNYMFALGSGIQIYSDPRSSMRLEYIYRHISNAHQGFQNPGVDQSVFRITFSRHR